MITLTLTPDDAARLLDHLSTARMSYTDDLDALGRGYGVNLGEREVRRDLADTATNYAHTSYLTEKIYDARRAEEA